MKKIIYSLIIALVTSFSIMSCTEEEVKPNSIQKTGGGGGVLTGDA
jgi:hypothetical protein